MTPAPLYQFISLNEMRKAFGPISDNLHLELVPEGLSNAWHYNGRKTTILGGRIEVYFNMSYPSILAELVQNVKGEWMPVAFTNMSVEHE
jgi:hypothetical protein